MKEIIRSKKEENEIKHHTRRLSIKEGIFASAKSSLGDNFIAPFTIAIGTASPLVAIINSLWNINPASQLFGSKLVEKFKRKAILTKTMSIEVIGWFLMALIAFLYFQGIAVNILPYLIAVTLFVILFASGIGHPSWFSLIGDVVDGKFRGKWFSKRNTIMLVAVISLTLLAALFLNYLTELGKGKIGFIVLFTLAFLARAVCISLIKRHYEPVLKIKKSRKSSLIEFWKDEKNSNFRKFAIFRGLFAASMGLTVPLVSIYLLRNLGFDYFSYVLILVSGSIFSVFSLNLWGKLSDKYGNYRVIAMTTLFLPLVPILWMLSTSKIYLFLVPAIIGGTSWSAFIMASSNFIYDNVKREKRATAISYFNLFAGGGALIGGLIGALLIGIIETTWIEPIFLIFIIGAIARMLVVWFWIPRLRETKKKKSIGGFRGFGRTILKEAKPVLVEDLHEIIEIKDYLQEK